MLSRKTFALAACLLWLPLAFTPAQADDDYGYYNTGLQAPDVTFYAALQGSKTNQHYLGGDWQGGFNVLLGGYFNDMTWAGWRYGVELGYQQFGESDSMHQRQVDKSEYNDPPTNFKSATEKTFRELTLSSLSLGIRLDSDYFYVRAGGALYNYHLRKYSTFFTYFTDGTRSVDDIPRQSQSKASIAPYFGFGLNIPIIDHLSVTAGYDLYYMESHRLPSLNIGLQYTD